MSTLWIRKSLVLVFFAQFAVGCGLIQNASPAAPSGTAQQPAPAGQPTPTVQPAAAAPAATVGTSPTTAASSGTKATTGDTIQLDLIAGKSEARYRVREQLVDVSLPSDAIGRTQSITGKIVGKTDGSIVTADSKFVVDLRTLQSDRSQRDNFLRTSVLQTNQYPNATFVPKRTEGLPPTFPPTGKVTFKLIGDLTIRNVTKEVTWDVTCNPAATQGACLATTSFNFAYFNLTQPRVPVVLSVQDNITLEVDLSLQHTSS